jgi:hypothetical protein
MDPSSVANSALALASQIEKLGIVGILALIALLAGISAFYFRKALVQAHEQITTLKQMLLIVKIAADSAGAKYDLREIGDLDAMLRRGP